MPGAQLFLCEGISGLQVSHIRVVGEQHLVEGGSLSKAANCFQDAYRRFGARISDHRPDELPGSGVGGIEVLLLIGCAEHLAVHPLLEPVRMFPEEAECVLADHQWRNPQAGMYRSRRQRMETAPPSDLVRSGEAFSLSVSFCSLALSISQILL
jgi:hypothetical protein